MRIFLIMLLISIVVTIVFWNFGLARLIWPAHPMLVTTFVAAGCCIAVQLSMTNQRDKEQAQKLSTPPAK